MTDLSVVPGEAAEPVDGFSLMYVTAGGVEVRLQLGEAWAARLEAGQPVRRLRPFKGQRHLPGEWWSATDEHLVGFESQLERDHLMLLDFDPSVSGIASQPFWLSWSTDDGGARSHVPDYFARRRDGSGVVVDCRPIDRRRSRDVVAFDATRRMCDVVGWEYRLVGAASEALVRNVRWISGFRHSRYHEAGIAEALRKIFAEGAPLLAGAQKAGDPIAVLPRLFHLLWSHELAVDLKVPLHRDSLVSLPEVA